jgi:hypothetical protein
MSDMSEQGEHWMGLRVPLEVEDLRRLEEISQSEGVQLLEWDVWGQPQGERFTGAFQVEPERVPGLVQELLALNYTRLRVELYPYGLGGLNHVVVRVESLGGYRG